MTAKLIISAMSRAFHRSSVLSHTNIKMPSLSPTMSSGTIVKWNLKEGDSVSPGDVLCEIQTDKAVVALETEDEGILAKIFVREDSEPVPVGRLIAVLAEPGEDWKSINIVDSDEPPKMTSVVADVRKYEVDSVNQVQQIPMSKSSLLGPAVKLLLERFDIKSEHVNGTGPKGIVLKRDVMEYINKNKSERKSVIEQESVTKRQTDMPTAPSSLLYDDVPLTNMRKTIAKRLTQSKCSIPHCYATTSVNINAISGMRSDWKRNGFIVSINDFIVKAVAHALQNVPEVNVQYVNESVHRQNSVDVSIAVATESGLITPIVHNVDRLGILQISALVKKLSAKARENRLQLHEFQGGTFTISNLGMFGISSFTAIINPPQAAILAVGGVEDCLAENLSVHKRMRVTLCFDNRAIGEQDAARFLSAFQTFMEDRDILLYAQTIPSTAASADFDFTTLL